LIKEILRQDINN